MMIQRRIPVFFRVPLALLCDAVIGFGPIALGLYLKAPSLHIAVVLVPGVVWLVIFDRFVLWRLDCFWNVKTMRNRTGRPEDPNNHRSFKTLKGWLSWLFIGKDIEHRQSPNQALHETGDRHGRPLRGPKGGGASS